ncbi:MAG: hypothetical protein ACPGLV_14730, partial [Bacteroidia bacterium]
KALITVGLVMVSVFAFAGGPWATGKANGYFQPGFTTKNWNGRYQGTYANTIFRDLNRQVNETNITFYGEYGLSDKITIVADAYYRLQSTSGQTLNPTENPFATVLPSGQLNAFGNPGLMAKYHFSVGNLAAAAYGKISPNISRRDEVIGLQSDYNATAATFGFFIGQGFSKSYWSFDAGFCARANNYSESILGNFQYGYAIRPKTYLILDINYMVSFENGTYNAGNIEQTATYIDNQGYVAYGAKVYSQLYKNISFNLAFYSGFAVINQGNQPGGIFGGIAYELNQ